MTLDEETFGVTSRSHRWNVGVYSGAGHMHKEWTASGSLNAAMYPEYMLLIFISIQLTNCIGSITSEILRALFFSDFDILCCKNVQTYWWVLEFVRGTRWRSWLRHFTTNRRVAGSIPDGVTGIFHWHNPSGRTMALGLTQPLTEMSTRNISWGV